MDLSEEIIKALITTGAGIMQVLAIAGLAAETAVSAYMNYAGTETFQEQLADRLRLLE